MGPDLAPHDKVVGKALKAQAFASALHESGKPCLSARERDALLRDTPMAHTVRSPKRAAPRGTPPCLRAAGEVRVHVDIGLLLRSLPTVAKPESGSPKKVASKADKGS